MLPFSLFAQHRHSTAPQVPLQSQGNNEGKEKQDLAFWRNQEGQPPHRPFFHQFSSLYLQDSWESSWLCWIPVPLNHVTRCLNVFLIESRQFVIICCSPGGHRKILLSLASSTSSHSLTSLGCKQLTQLRGSGAGSSS